MNLVKNKKVFLIINILLFFFCFVIFFMYNQSLYMLSHDRFFIYSIDIPNNFYPSSRLPSLIFNYLYYKILPDIFSMNPEDFRANIFVCSFISFLYMFLIITFSKGFYLSDNKKNYLLRKENIIILPLAFLTISAPLHLNELFCGIRQMTVFCEYSGGYIVFFSFFYVIFSVLLYKNKISKKLMILYCINALLLGMWSEFINIPAFISLVLIMFFYRKELINKYIFCLVLSFFAGLYIFYVSVGNYSLSSFGTLSDYSIIDNLIENLSNISIFTKEFISKLFIQKYLYWCAFLFSLISLKLYLLKHKNINGNKILYCGIFLISGFLLTAYSTILAGSAREYFLFDLFFFPLIQIHIMIYVILMYLGYLCFNSKISKIVISVILFIIIIVFSLFFIPGYLTAVHSNYDDKKTLHTFDKFLIVYSLFGESAILPENFVNSKNLSNYISSIKQNDRVPPKIGHYYNMLEYIDTKLYRYIYKHNIKGFTVSDTLWAEENFKKRLIYIEEIIEKPIKEKYNLFKTISYKDIDSYDKINLTIDKIEQLEKKYGNDDILLKAKAAINFQNKNYDKALELYRQYNKHNSDDYDSLINMAQIYKIKDNIAEAQNLYQILIKKDSENIKFLIESAQLYILSDDYNQALKYFLKADNLLLRENELYFVIALIYKKLGKDDMAEKYLKKTDKFLQQEFYNEYYNDEINLKKTILSYEYVSI